MGKDSVRSISNKVIKYDKQEVAPGKKTQVLLAQKTSWNWTFFQPLL